MGIGGVANNEGTPVESLWEERHPPWGERMAQTDRGVGGVTEAGGEGGGSAEGQAGA